MAFTSYATSTFVTRHIHHPGDHAPSSPRLLSSFPATSATVVLLQSLCIISAFWTAVMQLDTPSKQRRIQCVQQLSGSLLGTGSPLYIALGVNFVARASVCSTEMGVAVRDDHMNHTSFVNSSRRGEIGTVPKIFLTASYTSNKNRNFVVLPSVRSPLTAGVTR